MHGTNCLKLHHLFKDCLPFLNIYIYLYMLNKISNKFLYNNKYVTKTFSYPEGEQTLQID